MDVIYVQSRTRPLPTERLQDLSLSPILREDGFRTWQVSIRINHHAPIITTITDPFRESEYQTVLESYLRTPHRQCWGSENTTMQNQGQDPDDSSIPETRIRTYGQSLMSQLGVRPGLLRSTSPYLQLNVVEHYDGDVDAPDRPGGIHCLAWELLEAIDTRICETLAGSVSVRLRVTRISDFGAGRHRLPRPAPSLSSIQGDAHGRFHVLLVVARDFNRTGADRDPEPDLAQWPLMSVQKRLGGRMLLEVVRPGSLKELRHHLRAKAALGVHFHLVHFDLHGKIMTDDNGDLVPWLLFAKNDETSRPRGYQVPQTHLSKAEAVAELLAQHRIENVVLNACLSAYNRTGPATNLAHLFLKHGVENVSAMWYYVHWQTVATYLEAFYNELLLAFTDFHAAAQRGRDAIRDSPTMRSGKAHHDFFICVNYARDDSKSRHVALESVISLEAPSQDLLTSCCSVRGLTSRNGTCIGRPSAPRSRTPHPPAPKPSDASPVDNAPIMRLKLHLLELEYKLTTSRIVYASDLRRPGSDFAATVKRMVDMWLATNLIDGVFYYKAKDFAKSRAISPNSGTPHRARRTRTPSGGEGCCLPLPLRAPAPGPVRAPRQSLHIIRGVDDVVDPGIQADAAQNRRSERRGLLALEGLQRLARRLHREGHGYCLLLGRQDAQWWGTHLRQVGGEWWVHVPWHVAVHGRDPASLPPEPGGQRRRMGMESRRNTAAEDVVKR